jgi:hypothetical protein
VSILTVALTRDDPCGTVEGERDVGGGSAAVKLVQHGQKVRLTTHMHCGDLKVAVLHLDGNIVPVVNCHGPLHGRGRIQHVSLLKKEGAKGSAACIAWALSLTAMVMLKKRISFWFGAG